MMFNASKPLTHVFIEADEAIMVGIMLPEVVVNQVLYHVLVEVRVEEGVKLLLAQLAVSVTVCLLESIGSFFSVDISRHVGSHEVCKRACKMPMVIVSYGLLQNKSAHTLVITHRQNFHSTIHLAVSLLHILLPLY